MKPLPKVARRRYSVARGRSEEGGTKTGRISRTGVGPEASVRPMPNPLSLSDLETAVCRRLGIELRRPLHSFDFDTDECEICNTPLAVGTLDEPCLRRPPGARAVTGSDFDLVVEALAERSWGWRIDAVYNGGYCCTLYEPADWWIGRRHNADSGARTVREETNTWREAVCRAVVEIVPESDPSRCHLCNGPLKEADTYCPRCAVSRAVLEAIPPEEGETPP